MRPNRRQDCLWGFPTPCSSAYVSQAGRRTLLNAVQDGHVHSPLETRSLAAIVSDEGTPPLLSLSHTYILTRTNSRAFFWSIHPNVLLIGCQCPCNHSLSQHKNKDHLLVFFFLQLNFFCPREKISVLLDISSVVIASFLLATLFVSYFFHRQTEGRWAKV